jgi:tRNA (cytidine/uridine-2'-O-)-methyltransferase
MVAGRRIFSCTTKSSRLHDQACFQAGDVLLFGSETAGLPPEVLNSFSPEHRLRIPMLKTSRSLNLSNAVAIVSYEVWRQSGFKGGV